MKNRSLNKIFAISCLTMFSFSLLADIVVIVHPSNNGTLDTNNIKRIFLGKEKKFSNGSESLPINQVNGAASRSTFDSDVLGRSSVQVSSYWSKLVFTGKGIPPKEVADDAAVIDIVTNNPAAIGYIDSASVTSAVKAISLN